MKTTDIKLISAEFYVKKEKDLYVPVFDIRNNRRRYRT